jgi:hypothetical protein
MHDDSEEKQGDDHPSKRDGKQPMKEIGTENSKENIHNGNVKDAIGMHAFRDPTKHITILAQHLLKRHMRYHAGLPWHTSYAPRKETPSYDRRY